MLKKMLKRLVGLKHHHYSSSDSRKKYKSTKHKHYGHKHYKKHKSNSFISSFFSS